MFPCLVIVVYAGFALFLGLIIDRIHYYIKELQILKKKLDATEKLDRGN